MIYWINSIVGGIICARWTSLRVAYREPTKLAHVDGTTRHGQSDVCVSLNAKVACVDCNALVLEQTRLSLNCLDLQTMLIQYGNDT